MKINRQHFLAMFVSIASTVGLNAQILVEDHLDITFSYSVDDEIWNSQIRFGDFDNPNNEVAPDQATLPARDLPFIQGQSNGERYVQPTSSSFDFTGVPDGGPLWILPQSNGGHTWPGFRNGQAPGTFRSYVPTDSRVSANTRWVRIDLVDMAYVGTSANPQFSLWQSLSGGGFVIWMATSDGVDATDAFYLQENSHAHMNWGFSGLGLYRLSFRPSAILDSTGETVEGEAEAVYFAIGTKAAWTAEHYAGDDLFTESVSGDRSDSDKDGIPLLLEYAFNLDPVDPDYTILEPASGTSGLPLIRLLPDGDHAALEIEYLRRKADTNPQITYFAEFRGDLGSGDWDVQSSETVTSIDDTWERVVVKDPVSTDTAGQRFARVRVEVQETISY